MMTVGIVLKSTKKNIDDVLLIGSFILKSNLLESSYIIFFYNTGRKIYLHEIKLKY